MGLAESRARLLVLPVGFAPALSVFSDCFLPKRHVFFSRFGIYPDFHQLFVFSPLAQRLLYVSGKPRCPAFRSGFGSRVFCLVVIN
jgi:hypothetical protein